MICPSDRARQLKLSYFLSLDDREVWHNQHFIFSHTHTHLLSVESATHPLMWQQLWVLPVHLSASHIQQSQPLTKFPDMTHTNAMCSLLLYPSVRTWNTHNSPVKLLTDSSSGPHSKIIYLQISHYAII